MKKIEINLYSFSELPEKVQQNILRDNCTINVECDWWDVTYENISQLAESMGIVINTTSRKLRNGKTIEEPIFSFDINRGNFAFEGYLSFPDFKKVIEAKEFEKEFPTIAAEMPLRRWKEEIQKIPGNVKSLIEDEIIFDILAEVRNNDYLKVETSWDARTYVDRRFPEPANLNLIMFGVTSTLEEVVKRFCSVSLKMLTDEYEYMTSDEAIKEAVQEWEFFENGKVYSK